MDVSPTLEAFEHPLNLPFAYSMFRGVISARKVL
jgi:hypothetical protein